MIAKDIFDVIEEEKETDVFDVLAFDDEEKSLRDKIAELEKKILENRKKKKEIDKSLSSKEVEKLIEEKISKIKIPEAVQQKPAYVAPRVIQMAPPPQIIRETRVVEKTPQKVIVKEMMKMADVEKAIDEKIKEFKKQVYEKINRDIEDKAKIFIAPSPLPDPSGHSGEYLTNEATANGVVFKWGAISTSSGSETTIPIGPADTEGSWQIIISGDDLSFQRYESGSWVEKGVMQAS